MSIDTAYIRGFVDQASMCKQAARGRYVMQLAGRMQREANRVKNPQMWQQGGELLKQVWAPTARRGQVLRQANPWFSLERGNRARFVDHELIGRIRAAREQLRVAATTPTYTPPVRKTLMERMFKRGQAAPAMLPSVQALDKKPAVKQPTKSQQPKQKPIEPIEP